MKQELLNNNYLVVDDFISAERAASLYAEILAIYKQYPESFAYDTQCPKSAAIYDMWAFLELLVEKTPLVGELIGESVFPTYSYARMYTHGEELEKHIDRPSCEISVTLHLGNDGVEWPIYFKTPSGGVVKVNLHPGQAVIYLGCVAQHWREAYKGDDYRQVFLHYVRAKGENRRYYFDKRR